MEGKNSKNSDNTSNEENNKGGELPDSVVSINLPLV